MENSDVYDISISVIQNGRAATVTTATDEPGDMTWKAPLPLGLAPTMSVATTPYVTLQSTWPAYAAQGGSRRSR